LSEFNKPAAGDQPSAADYFRPIWRRRWLILIIAVIATVGTYVYYNRKPRVYEASTSLYVGNGSYVQSLLGEGGSNGDPTRTLTDLATLVDSPPVVADAEKLVGNPAHLGSVQASPATDSDFIDLSSRGTSPIYAAATVNAYARAFIQFRTQTLRQEAAVAIAQIEHQLGSSAANSPQTQSLQQELATLKTQESAPAGSIQQIAAAVPNPTPLSPDPKKDAIFALALSLMVGMALAYGLDRLDERIRSEEELQPLYELPVLGEIPQVLSPTPDDEGMPCVDHEQWESFRALRTNMELVTGAHPLRTIMVVSAQPSEGKSLVVRNLALAYADAGSRVAIVEADLRAPSLSKTLNVESEPGLSDVLAEVELLPEAIQSVALPADDRGGQALNGSHAQRVRVDLGNGTQRWHGSRTSVAVKAEPLVGSLDVLTSGGTPEHFSASLAAEGIKAVLARMTEQYDVVLIDSAPLLAVSDSVPLVGDVDGVVVVARIGTTSQQAARRLVELLGRVPGARVLGVVANSLAKKPFQYGAGYGTGYGA
jgi:Mrp family chromosome partitioning ATPase/capsular polysaccharide biosynthesis protein